MNVGIIGSGDVGLKLGDGFLALGDTVKIGTRNTSKENIVSWVAKNDKKATAGSFTEAASFGDLVLIATLWSGTMDAIKLANPKNLSGKIIIDVTNPLDFSKMPPSLAIGHTTSGGEMIQMPKEKWQKFYQSLAGKHSIWAEL
jgi:predicted dinucleotide-binding enzyme